jgi:fibronectin-binding autotransporter adhesin
MIYKRANDERTSGRGSVALRRRQRWLMRPTLLALEQRALLSTIVVNNPTDTPVAGDIDLRQAIALANVNGGDEAIVFDSTVFNAPLTITLAGTQLELSDTTGTVSITGPAAGVTISGGGASRVFQVDDAVTASFTGLTIADGSTSGTGGGVNVNGGAVTLTDCTISGNTSGNLGGFGGYGGGLANAGGNVALYGCTIRGNTVADGSGGGGLATLTTGTTTLTDCTISENTCEGVDAAGDGLILFGQNALSTLTDCTVSGNLGGHAGGGLAVYFGDTAVLTNRTVSGNSTSGSGGGLNIKGTGTAVLTNCTVSGNSAGVNGGGVCSLYGSSSSLTNCTISNNTASYVGGVLGEGSSITENNTIVAGNSHGDFNIAGSPIGSHNLIGGDPVLAPLGNYGGPTQTMPELPGSPALGAGSVALAVDPQGNPLTTDQRGLPRITSETLDIGAFQSEGFTFTLVPGSTPQTSTIGTAFANPLAVAVTAKNPIEPVNGGFLAIAAGPADNGASAIFQTPAAAVANGIAAVTAAPDNIVGSYSVVASTSGWSASFQLTNAGTPFAALVVNSTSDSIAPGPGLLSLREAVGFANTAPSGNSTITFDRNVFNRPQVINLTGSQVELSNTTGTETITGPTAGVTISGGGISRVFEVDAGVTASFSGLTITGGSTAGNGGGLYNDGGSVTLTACALSGNSAVGTGGGLDGSSGSTTLTNCTLGGNTARSGGGVSLSNSMNKLTRCTISGNSAYFGGGMYIDEGVNALNGCTISGNSATLFVGGVGTVYGVNTLTGCSISGNTATFTGGAGLYGGMNTLTGCSISGNTAEYSTGGLELYGGVSTLTGCTISGNIAARYNSGGVSINGTATLTGCTISGNSAGTTGGGLYTGFAGSATLTNCTITGNSAGSDGGGLFNGSGGSTTLTHCSVSGNSAVAGGGVYNSGTLNVAWTNVSNNRAIGGAGGGAGEGGGIFSNGGSLVLGNSTLAANIAFGGAGASGGAGGDGIGGGLALENDATATVTNTIFLRNLAQGGAIGAGTKGGDGIGGGIAVAIGGASDTSSLALNNSLVAGNVAQGGRGGSEACGGDGSGGGIFVGAGGSATIDQTDIFVNVALGGMASGLGGDGSGGGLYVTSGAVVTLKKTAFAINVAGTSNRDVFGTVIYL